MRYILLALVLAGCSPKEVVVKSDTVYVPYQLLDTVNLVRVDTVYSGESEHTIIRIDTLWRRAYVKIRDTVTVVDTDTVTVVRITKVDPTAFEVFVLSYEYWVSTFILGAIVCGVGILFLIRKFKPTA